MWIIRSRHSDVTVRTNLSTKAFRFGEPAERRTDFTPAASRVERNTFVSRVEFERSVGVSGQTVKNWEEATGALKPNAKSLTGLTRLHQRAAK